MSSCQCSQCFHHNKVDDIKDGIIRRLKHYGLPVETWWDVTDLLALLEQARDVERAR